MKRNLSMVLFAVLGLALGTSCEKEDDLRSVDRELSEALNSKFPEAGWVEWEKNRDFYVAEFHNAGTEVKVWYTGNAQWWMTETDLGWNAETLPETVKEAFGSSAYAASWRVDDIDKYERPGETFYLIEIEKAGERDRDLFYTESGTLLKDDKDRGDVHPDTKI